MTRQRRWLARLAILLTVATAACGSGEEVALDGEPADMLRRSVERAEGTVRLLVHARTDAHLFVATEQAEGIAEHGGDFQVTITRDFEFPDGDGSGELASRLDMLAGTTELVHLDDITYRTVPENAAGVVARPLPEGIEWIADRSADAASVADLHRYLGTRGLLDLLDGVAAVEDAGPTEIDGIQVRWLKATTPDTGGLADAIGPGTTIDVAVDADGGIRSIAFVPRREEGFRTQIIVKIRDVGIDDTVRPPPADATIDRSELDPSDRPTP